MVDHDKVVWLECRGEWGVGGSKHSGLTDPNYDTNYWPGMNNCPGGGYGSVQASTYLGSRV